MSSKLTIRLTFTKQNGSQTQQKDDQPVGQQFQQLPLQQQQLRQQQLPERPIEAQQAVKIMNALREQVLPRANGESSITNFGQDVYTMVRKPKAGLSDIQNMFSAALKNPEHSFTRCISDNGINPDQVTSHIEGNTLILDASSAIQESALHLTAA